MADQEQSHTVKHGTSEQPQRDYAVGRDIPDESKERHTEIAVEAGRKYGEHHANKR